MYKNNVYQVPQPKRHKMKQINKDKLIILGFIVFGIAVSVITTLTLLGVI
jgi:hypothetical protein